MILSKKSFYTTYKYFVVTINLYNIEGIILNNENIILIGFMGVGKGTVARALVKQSDYFAVDTDDLIESLENKKIKKIFEQNGEPYFRSLEKKCALWCEHNITKSIISTGGGFYKQENIKKIGRVIYLQSTFEKILEGINPRQLNPT